MISPRWTPHQGIHLSYELSESLRASDIFLSVRCCTVTFGATRARHRIRTVLHIYFAETLYLWDAEKAYTVRNVVVCIAHGGCALASWRTAITG